MTRPWFPKFDDNIQGFTYWEACAIGLVDSAQVFHKFGYNPAVGAAFETVWDVGSIFQYPPAGAASLIVSASSLDVVGEAGAHTVKISGVDSAWDLITEVVALNGRSPVTLVNTFCRYFRVEVESIGAGGSDAFNKGLISIGVGSLAGGLTTTYAAIASGWNQSNMSVMAIPRKTSGYMIHLEIFTSLSKQTLSRLLLSVNGGPFKTRSTLPLLASEVFDEFKAPFVFPERSDIEIQAATVPAGGPIGAEFTVVLVPNSG